MIKNRIEEIKKTRNYLLNFYSSEQIAVFCGTKKGYLSQCLNGQRKAPLETQEYFLQRMQEMKKYANKKIGVI